MKNARLKPNDSRTLGLVISAFFEGAISQDEVVTWAAFAISEVPDCPHYVGNLLEIEGKADIFRALPFVPESPSAKERVALDDWGKLRRGESDGSKLAAFPALVDEIREAFPFLELPPLADSNSSVPILAPTGKSRSLSALSYDEEVEADCCEFHCSGAVVRLLVYGNVPRAEHVAGNFDVYVGAAADFATEVLLELSNREWLPAGQRRMEATELRALFEPVEIEVADDGGVIFSFRTGDVFAGHLVSVSMNAANEFLDAWL